MYIHKLTAEQQSILGEIYGDASSAPVSPVIGLTLKGMRKKHPQRNIVLVRNNVRSWALHYRRLALAHDMKRDPGMGILVLA